MTFDHGISTAPILTDEEKLDIFYYGPTCKIKISQFGLAQKFSDKKKFQFSPFCVIRFSNLTT